MHGTVVALRRHGTLTYTPDADFNGADTFNYTVQDNGTTNGIADLQDRSSTSASR